METGWDLHCPRCQLPLAELEYQGQRPAMCARCRGVYLRAADIEAKFGRENPLSEAKLEFSPIEERPDCPRRCSPMSPHVVTQGHHSVVIDVCPSCRGVWFDAGEVETLQRLGRVRRQAEHAGRARRRERTAVEDARRILAHDRAKRKTHDDDAVTKSSGGWWLVSFITQMPLEGWNPVYRFPLWTWLIVLANVLVFVTQIALGPDFTKQFVFVPGQAEDGAMHVMRALTASFMHGGPAHLIGNMYFLKIFGDNVEDRLGRVWFVLFYFAADAMATLTYVATTTDLNTPVLGASGAVSGLLGAYLVFFPDARVSVAPMLITLFRQIHLRAYFFLPIWLGLQLIAVAIGGGGVAWWAHIGGFVGGFVLATLANRLLPDARVAHLARRLAKGEEIER